ncbi:hypothetical protein MP228_011735 [Amoeboaphelidium protococcarum]|nr:hypothetical protein MP228_011735 [Amoeboaphelidium protococcarum]
MVVSNSMQIPKGRGATCIKFVNDDCFSVSTISGHLYTYRASDLHQLSKIKVSAESLCSFDVFDHCVYAVDAGSGLSLYDCESARVVSHLDDQLDFEPEVIKVLPGLSASSGSAVSVIGGVDGHIAIHDFRQRKCVYQWNDVHEGEIRTFLQRDGDSKSVISLSEDGYLSVFDIRKVYHKPQPQAKDATDYGLIARSDNMEAGMLCGAVMKHGKRVVVGFENPSNSQLNPQSSNDVIGIFNWDNWGDMSDRFVVPALDKATRHTSNSESITAMVKVNEDEVLIGNEAGVISLVNVQPNKVIRTLNCQSSSSLTEVKKIRQDVEMIEINAFGSTLITANMLGHLDVYHNFTAFLDGTEAADNSSQQSKQSRRKRRKQSREDDEHKVTNSFYADM